MRPLKWKHLPTPMRPLKLPYFYWQLSIFSPRLLLDFPFPNVFCSARILIKHLDSLLETCRFLIMHSESPANTGSVPAHKSYFSLPSSRLCLALFPRHNMYVWISSLNLYMPTKMVSHPEWGMTSWNSWVLLLCSKCCSTAFCLLGIPKVCPMPVCALSVDSLYWIKMLSLFLKFRAFTKSIGNKTISPRGMEV